MKPLDERRNPQNRVLDCLSMTETGATAMLIVDQDHPFFFDHPLDHVPGLLLLEGASQLGHAICNSHTYIHRLTATFDRFALLNAPVELTATIGVDDHGTLVEVEISQDGIHRARVEVVLADAPIHIADRSKENETSPCRTELLNKHRDENVLITAPVLDDETIATQLTMRDVRCLLIDSRIAMHPLHLLESFMQTQRFLNNSSPDSARIRDILLGVEIRQTAPVNAGADVRLIGDRLPVAQPRRRLKRGATAFAGGRAFAEMSITTANVNAA